MNENRGLWRGKRTDTKAWITGDLMNGTDLIDCTEIAEHTGVGSRYDVIPETLGECTCVSDKNDRLIFEGDILRADGYYTTVGIGIVRYGEYGATIGGESYHIGFYVEWLGKKAGLLRIDLGYWTRYATVIGNIHDNPELISGQTD